MTAPATEQKLWTLCLLTKSDFDDDLNSWSWDADLLKYVDGTYRATVTQCPGAPGDEDWEAAELTGPLRGEQLFQFLHGSWTEHTSDALKETQWLKVASVIRRKDKVLAAEFSAAVKSEFHPQPGQAYVPPAVDVPLERCVQRATWSTSGAGGAGGLGGVVFMNLRRRAAYMYASRYRGEHGCLPTGTHRVVAQVGPPNTGADFQHPMGQGTCSLSVDITFPREEAGMAVPNIQHADGLPPPELPSEALVAAYRNTDYIASPGDISLRVDGPVPHLAEWLRAHGAKSASIVTAFNPFSAETPQAENQRLQDELRMSIEAAGRSHFPARGVARSGGWPPEPSLCVFDPTAAELDDWLTRFGQYAAVHATSDGRCELVWHPSIRQQMART